MKPLRVTAVLSLAVSLWIPAAADSPGAPPPLKVTELGRGPTVVFVHGLGGGRMTWMPTARKLLADHHVVMMDLPGHGDSPLPDPFTLDLAAAQIAQTLAGQKADSTVVVAQGIGGFVSLLAAVAHPERLRGLLVIDTGLKTETPIPEQQQKYFLQALDNNYDGMLKMMYARLGRDSAQSAVLHAQAAQVPAATIKAYIREMLNADGSKALKNLKTPLLFVGSSKNWTPDKDWPAVARAEGFADSDSLPHVRIGDCGPMIWSERPDSLAAVIADFEARTLAKK